MTKVNQAWSVGNKPNEYVSAYDYSVQGDGSDETSKLQELFDSGAKVIVIPALDFGVSGQITIDNPCHIIAHGATFTWPSDTTADRALVITSSDVTIEGLELVGPQFASKVSTQRGIWAYGVDNNPLAPTYINNLKIIDCKISNWGFTGIEMRFVDGFDIVRCEIKDCFENGISGLSVANGVVDGNHIENIPDTDGAWGISMSRNNGGDIVRRPLCRDVRIVNNYVKDVTHWTGIDTHGGVRIVMANNIVHDCFRGYTITVFDNTGAGGSTIEASRNCVCDGNVARNDNIPTTEMGGGINLGGTASIKGSNNVVSNNIIHGYGDSDNVLTGTNTPAVNCLWQNGLILANNIVTNSGLIGINLFGLGTNNLVTNNTITTITGTGGQAYRIDASGQPCEIFIDGGVVDVPGHTVFFAEEQTECKIGYIDIRDYTTLYDQTGGVLAAQYFREIFPVISGLFNWDPPSIPAGGSATTQITPLPGVSGNSSAVLSVNRDLEGLILSWKCGDIDTNDGDIDIYLYNNTSGAIDLASLKVRYEVSLRNPAVL